MEHGMVMRAESSGSPASTKWVTLWRSFNFSDPQFHHLQNEGHHSIHLNENQLQQPRGAPDLSRSVNFSSRCLSYHMASHSPCGALAPGCFSLPPTTLFFPPHTSGPKHGRWLFPLTGNPPQSPLPVPPSHTTCWRTGSHLLCLCFTVTSSQKPSLTTPVPLPTVSPDRFVKRSSYTLYFLL